MSNQTTVNKMTGISNLSTGDKVKLVNGKTATFIRLKKRNFIGVMNGNSYDIPIEMFVKVVSEASEQMKEIASTIKLVKQKKRKVSSLTAKNILSEQIEYLENQLIIMADN